MWEGSIVLLTNLMKIFSTYCGCVLQRVLPLSAFRQLMSGVLLLSYLALGVIGFPGTLELLRALSAKPYVEKERPGPTPIARAYWTQHKHIAASFKLPVLSPAIVPASDFANPNYPHLSTTAVGSSASETTIRNICSGRAPPSV